MPSVNNSQRLILDNHRVFCQSGMKYFSKNTTIPFKVGLLKIRMQIAKTVPTLQPNVFVCFWSTTNVSDANRRKKKSGDMTGRCLRWVSSKYSLMRKKPDSNILKNVIRTKFRIFLYFLSAFYSNMCLMKAKNNFEKIAILKHTWPERILRSKSSE